MNKKEYILNWIERVSILRSELNGFSICPYAKSGSYEIVECSVWNYEMFGLDEEDVRIMIIEDHLSLKEVQRWVNVYNQFYDKWSYFEDCKSYDTFINEIQTNNGKYNLILGQPKEKLKKAREALAKTSYYSLWKEDYLKEILQDDLNSLDLRR